MQLPISTLAAAQFFQPVLRSNCSWNRHCSPCQAGTADRDRLCGWGERTRTRKCRFTTRWAELLGFPEHFGTRCFSPFRDNCERLIGGSERGLAELRSAADCSGLHQIAAPRAPPHEYFCSRRTQESVRETSQQRHSRLSCGAGDTQLEP